MQRIQCHVCGGSYHNWGKKEEEDPSNPVQTAETRQDLLSNLSAHMRSFWSPSQTIPRVSATELTYDQFLRQYVHLKRPVILTSMLATEFPSVSKWADLEYLRWSTGDSLITVDVTPDGHADCIKIDPATNEPVFIKPAEIRISLNDFLDHVDPMRYDMDKKYPNCVMYYSHQNDCLRRELPDLIDELHISINTKPDDTSLLTEITSNQPRKEIPTFNIASEAFGNDPDAINIWIGDGNAVSSLHKDPYENLHAVVSGEKHFVLMPPSDTVFLKQKNVRQARYKYTAGEFTIEYDQDESSIPWIETDPITPEGQDPTCDERASPIHCVVREGEVLYLPSLWYHRVAQRKGLATISLNFWHDMEFEGAYYPMFQFMNDVGQFWFNKEE